MPCLTSPLFSSLVAMQRGDEHIFAVVKQHTTVQNAVFFCMSDQGFVGEIEARS
jgi:hypothetical protein